MPKRRPVPPAEHAVTTSEHGRLIARAIRDAIHRDAPKDADVLTVYSERVYQCSQQTNIWTGTDLHNEHGEPFDGAGRFWTCGQKLCPYCLQKQSQRNRKILRRRIAEQHSIWNDPTSKPGLLSGQYYKFLTLTMTNPGIPLIETRKIINYAWSIFRKRVWFQRTFIGGCKAEEFTLTKAGYHYHLHLLVRCKSIDWDTWRHLWTESVATAFADAKRPFSVANKDELLSCTEVALQYRGTAAGGLEDGIKEVAKYITKSDSWHRLRTTDLLDVVRIERWPRMFEFFGSFRATRSVSEPVAGLEGEDNPDEERKNAANKTILDTTEISDLETVAGWRKKLRERGLSQYLRDLQKQIERMKEVRIFKLREKYGAAKLIRKRGDALIHIGEIEKRLRDIYDRNGLPPPATLSPAAEILPVDDYSNPYELTRAHKLLPMFG